MIRASSLHYVPYVSVNVFVEIRSASSRRVVSGMRGYPTQIISIKQRLAPTLVFAEYRGDRSEKRLLMKRKRLTSDGIRKRPRQSRTEILSSDKRDETYFLMFEAAPAPAEIPHGGVVTEKDSVGNRI